MKNWILVGLLGVLSACSANVEQAPEASCIAGTYEAGAPHVCDQLGSNNPIVLTCDGATTQNEREKYVGANLMHVESAAPGATDSYCYDPDSL